MRGICIHTQKFLILVSSTILCAHAEELYGVGDGTWMSALGKPGDCWVIGNSDLHIRRVIYISLSCADLLGAGAVVLGNSQAIVFGFCS